jgi:hypothetical protein
MKGKSGRELFPEKLFSCSKAPAWEQVSQLVWTMNASCNSFSHENTSDNHQSEKVSAFTQSLSKDCLVGAS